MIAAWLRLMALTLWMLAGGAVAAILYYLRLPEVRDRFVVWGYKLFLRIARIKLVVTGTLSHHRPLMLVSNHVSYMDIPILASVASVRFTPKVEIARWPVIGFFCRVMDCVFIDRRVSSTGRNKKALEETLRRGEVIGLFPEGTTGDGKRVLPFRSSYFSLCELGHGKTVAVQPTTLSYSRVNGLPIDSVQMPRIAWYGDMLLLPHILDFLKLGSVNVELRFHEAMTLDKFGSRKEMAVYCHDVVVEHKR